MAKNFPVEIITAEKLVYSGEATVVFAKTTLGDIGFMAGHIPYVGALSIAPIKIVEPDGEAKMFAVHGGIIHIDENSKLEIAARVAESVEDIDIEQAKRLLENPDAEEGAIKSAQLRVELSS